MILKCYPKSYIFRHALSLGLAVFTAIIINQFYAFSANGWIILTTFLVSHTTRGTPLRQGLIYFLAIVAAVLISAFMLTNLSLLTIHFILALFFIISAYLL